MITFKQYLYEMPSHSLNGPDYLEDFPARAAGRYDREEYGKNMHGPYTMKLHSANFSPERRSKPHAYMAEHDNGEIHFVSRGGTTADNHFIANETRKHSDAEINAPEFYKEILHQGHHDGIQSGTSQTDGGASIWHRLAHEHDDVVVTHHEYPSLKQIPLHKGDDWDKNFNEDKPSVFRMRLK